MAVAVAVTGSKTVVEPVEEEMVSVEEDLESHEQQGRELVVMQKALMALGEPCKSLIKAFYLDKKNMTDIADVFGYTNADNAKKQKYKCLQRLKKVFFQNDTE